MLEAHNQGKTMVITCPLEPAEFRRERIQSFGLGVSVQRG